MTAHSSLNRSFGRRRSGSILIMVVALLTLVALIGTALIATARIDRYTTRAYVRTTSNDALRSQFLDQVTSDVERTLLQDATTDVDNIDSFYHDSWLAERLPITIPGSSPRAPMWAYVSGRLATQTDSAAHTANQAPYTEYQPPYQPNSSSPVSVADYIRMNPKDAAYLSHPAIPTSISLTYPAKHPEESIRNKTRTFPALKFTDFAGTADNGTYLAADADGDGIADSVLRQLTPAPIDGVTYYYAIRIIDNASAINVNTAWSRDDEFLFAGANQRTFFSSNIGLYELLSPKTDTTTTNRKNRDNEITALNEFRLGYGASGYPSNASFNPFTDTGALPVLTTDKDAIADADANVTYGNSGTPTKRTDFEFASQAEALDLQLGWRIENPGYRAGVAGFKPPSSRDITSPVAGSPFQFAAYAAADGAALAYRFCMVDPDVAPSDLENRLLISAYQSAPNYLAPYGTSNVPNWKFYPADKAVRWFQWLDYDNPGLDANNEFDEINTTGSSSGTRRFPSVRPLLTTWNPVSDRITEKYNTVYSWDRTGNPKSTNNYNLLYPGMMYNDVKSSTSTRFRGTWASSGVTYQYGDIVEDGTNGLYYMYVWGANGNSPQAPNTYFPPNPAPTIAAGQTRADYWDPQPFVSGQVKTSVNTAGFPELWRAYFETMTDATGTDVPTVISSAVAPILSADPKALDNPYLAMGWNPATMADTTAGHPAAMFRSPIRSPETVATPPHRLTPHQTAVLRSALAAVNTVDLRSASTSADNQDITAKTFTLYDTNGIVGGTPASPVPQYRVTVYGTKRQPYITEVYANNDANIYVPTGQNPSGYIAIELHNPYNTPISLNNWRMASFDRRVPSGAPTDYAASGSTLTQIIQFNAAVTIPANGYLIVENFLAGSTASGSAAYRPPSTKLPRIEDQTSMNTHQPLVQYVYAPLGVAMDREIVLLRPRVVNANVPVNQITDMVPVDSYDLTGLAPATTACQTWHYVRNSNAWQFVYPGRYDASVAYGTPRHQGTYTTTIYDPTPVLSDSSKIDQAGTFDEWNPPHPVTENPPFGANAVPVVPGQPVTLGGEVSAGAIVFANADNAGANYPDVFTIQLANAIPATGGMPGPYPAQMTGTGNLFPFGTFARNGDILQVPFIGAYKIELLTASGSPGAIDPGAWPAGFVPADGSAANPSILDFNAVTLDSAFAEDTITGNNVVGGESVGRFCPPVGGATSVYDWAKTLFNFLDVRSPANDYLPNFDPGSEPYKSTLAANLRPQPVANKPGLAPNPPGTPSSVSAASVAKSANLANEDYASRQGRLNVNTAPAAALAMVPFVADPATSKPDPTHTKAVASAIAAFRSTTGSANNGEFTTLFDLNRLPIFANGDGTLAVSTLDPTPLQGDFTPVGGGDGIVGDFEAQYLTLNRVSNLLTTRSDCFTVYIVVQGWRDAGTPFPVLDWEQRAAYIMDRSSGSVVATPVPTD